MPYQVPQKTLDRLYPFVAGFEGNIPHLYRDSVGVVTVGIGFALFNLQQAQAIGLQPADRVAADFAAVSAAPLGRVAAFYKQFTTCTLPPEILRAEFDKRVQGFAQTLYPSYDLATYPEEAVVCILDMAYNLGAGALLSKWPKFKASCQARDWKSASQQCVRKGVQPSRNLSTSALFAKIAIVV